MKRLIALVACALLAVSLLPLAALADPSQDESFRADELPGLDVQAAGVSGKSAQEIVRDMKIGWNLGNTFESWLDDSTGSATETLDRDGLLMELVWGNPTTTPEMIQFIQDAGFNAVRIPVSWFQHLAPAQDDPYHIDEAWMARVHEVVDYCYDRGLYVIVNMHHDRLWLESPQFGEGGSHREMVNARMAALWSQIAAEFADYDQRLIFEGLNEPRASSEPSDEVQIDHDREWGSPTAGDIETLNSLYQTFVTTVRSVESPYQSTRLLLVPTMSGSTALPMISQLVIPDDDFLGVSAHPYEPYHFVAASQESWMDHTWSNANQVALEQVFYRMYATFTAKGIPVVLDEFNAQDCDNTDERVKWAKRYIELARSYGMTCFLWDSGSSTPNSFGNVPMFFDRKKMRWANAGQELMVKTLITAAADDTATTAWRSACETPVPDGSAPVGRQLNSEEATTTGRSVCVSSVRWSEIEGGDVAIQFSGSRPTLVMTDKNGEGWTTADPSYVAWNEQASGGVAYFWPDHLQRLWCAGATNGQQNTTDTLRQLKIVSSSGSTTVHRFVLTGTDPLPDVSGGGYGEGVGVRLLYTRPFTLSYVKDDSGQVTSTWNTVAINTENPDVPGKDMAVRYTGDAPYLVFVDMADDHKWHGWTSVRPHAEVPANDGTGQKVAFFRWADITEAWAAARAKDGASWQFDSVSVAVSSGTCNLVELVALGGEVRERPQMRPAAETLDGDELVKELYAGYNLGGHMEANYVPKNADGTPAQTKDGGWGDGDLDLEAHWSRGSYITREMIHAIAQRGFKTVRLPVTWFQHLHDESGSPYGANTIDRAWMARVHELVDWCLQEDLYVVVNLHHENWIDRADLDTAYDNTDMPMKFRAIWTQIANEFSGYDQRLVFEAMNEPHAEGCGTDREWNQPNAGDISAVNRLNADFVSLMRSMPDHVNRLLLVPPFAASTGDAAHNGFVLPDDPSDLIAVSLHNYTPHSYTHYFMSNAAADPAGHVLTDTQRAEIERSFERIRLNCTSKGWRVVLGEFGVPYSTDGHVPDQEYWMTRYITFAKEQGFPCLYWRMDHGTSDGTAPWTMLDDTNSTWTGALNHLVDTWFGILDDDGVEWGINAYASPDEHEDMSSGEALISEPKLLDESDNANASWRTGRIALGWSDIEGHEIAVKFTGSRPRLSLLTGWDGDWWGVEPYVVDNERGIAYFPAKSIKAAWEQKGYKLADLNGMCVRTDGNLLPPDVRVEEVWLIHCHEWGAWEHAQEATCEKPGSLVRTCALDANHVLSRSTPALGHEEDGGAITQPPTETDPGVRTYRCVRCSKVLRTEEVDPLGQDAVENAYRIVANADATWTRGSAEGLTIVSEAEFPKFIGVTADGAEVPSSHFDAVSGSTRVTLYPDYLETLSDGLHAFAIRSTDGTAQTHFTIVDQASSQNSGVADPSATAPSTPASQSEAPAQASPSSTSTPAPANHPNASNPATGNSSNAPAANKSATPRTGDNLALAIPLTCIFAALAAITLIAATALRRRR